jgi:hypothetical protein
MTTVTEVLPQGEGLGSVTSSLHLSLGLAKVGFHVRFVCPRFGGREAGTRTYGRGAWVTARERFSLSHTIERTIAVYRLVL